MLIISGGIVTGTFASSSGWTVGANWSIGSGKATYTSGASNALTTPCYHSGRIVTGKLGKAKRTPGGE